MCVLLSCFFLSPVAIHSSEEKSDSDGSSSFEYFAKPESFTKPEKGNYEIKSQKRLIYNPT